MLKAPYGSWASPITAARLAQAGVIVGDVRVWNGKPYWYESRPAEGGRYVVVTSDGKGAITELTPAGFGARTRVHEYGGTPFALRGSTLYFSNFADQRLYAQNMGAEPVALTPEGYYYADCVLDPDGHRLLCVREDHTGDGEPRNAIVSVPVKGGSAGTVLFDRSDFVAYPRINRDGSRLAWIAWNHPDMPWDATTLYVGNFSGDELVDIKAVAGDPRESVVEPAWDVDGTLYFISDRSNWWNLHRLRDGRIEPVLSMEAESAGPLWALGQTNYALTGDGRAVVRYSVAARDKLGVLDLKSGKLATLDLPFVSFSSVQLTSPNSVVVVAASERASPAVVSIDLHTGRHEIVRAPNPLEPELAGSISIGEPIEFPTTGGRTAYAFFYPPTNASYSGPPTEKPPVLVEVHGGPTSHAKPVLELKRQFWTSRGFAVVDVNYRGSSGFGRTYRESLNGNWGVADIDDVVAAVKYLASTGRVDPNRAAIRGGSAGGFTTLAALAFRDVFKAGANYYGVSDLKTLARDTHKFESRYLDRLVGPLPQAESIYEERSPVLHLEGFREPLITFQGAEDCVVPPEQSRTIVQALKKSGIPVAYLEFEGEQHGFRKAQTIMRAAEAELYFYGRIFGFTPADRLEPVTIENLKPA